MKKNTFLAIVLLVAVVVAFSLLPLSSAKKPPKPDALKVILSGDLVTVDNCGDLNPKEVDLVKGPRGTLQSTGRVAVLLNFESTHGRLHRFDGSFTWDTPSCREAEQLRVRVDGKILLALVLIDMDEITLKAKGVGHGEAFNLWAGVEGGDFHLGSLIEPVGGELVSELHHFDIHNGKQAPDRHKETDAFSGNLAITGDLS